VGKALALIYSHDDDGCSSLVSLMSHYTLVGDTYRKVAEESPEQILENTKMSQPSSDAMERPPSDHPIMASCVTIPPDIRGRRSRW
jgi:hypothetical protein